MMNKMGDKNTSKQDFNQGLTSPNAEFDEREIISLVRSPSNACQSRNDMTPRASKTNKERHLNL